MRASKQRQPKQVTIVDKEVGERIAAMRKLRGTSQSALGAAVGVTFQQIQKYEKGVNRASAGRLQQIATVLGVPLSSFFNEVVEVGPLEGEVFSALKEPGAAALLRAYTSIRTPEGRREALRLVRELAGAERPARSRAPSGGKGASRPKGAGRRAA